MKFKQYLRYKESGVLWLGEIPEAWTAVPFKREIDRNDGGVWGDEPDAASGVLTTVLRSTEQSVDGRWKIDEPAMRKLSNSELEGALLLEGDLVVTKSSGSSLHIGKTTIVTAAIAERRCCYSNFMQRIRVRGTFVPKFAWYVMNSDISRVQFDVLSNSTTGLANLNSSMIGELLVPVAPVVDQHAIAAFLDRETAKIDTLITKQEELIDLLKEKRQAVISHAVTKGLDSTVPMKPSGIEWLGDVPQHWGVTRLKHAASLIVDCPHETPIYDPDGGYLVIRTADVSAANLDLSNAYRLNEEEYRNRIRRAELKANDIVYSREGERWGFAALVPDEPLMCLGQRMMQFRSDRHYSSFFLMWHLNADCIYSQGEVDVVGATSPHVNVETICNFALCEPPLIEQIEIANFVQRTVEKIDILITKAKEAIALQKEHRSALISAAVTGKIDVRDAVSGLLEAA